MNQELSYNNDKFIKDNIEGMDYTCNIYTYTYSIRTYIWNEKKKPVLT